MATKNVDPKKSAASKKAAATRRANAEAAARRQEEETKPNLSWILPALLGLALIVVLLLWHPWSSVPAVPTATETPPVVNLLSTDVPVPTEVPTEAPAVVEPTLIPAPAPVAVSCDTPFIDASLDNGTTYEAKGLFLDTNLGKRMTFTSRSLLIPEKEWNVELTSAELKTVEETWQSISICVPEGTFARIFAGGFEQKLNHLDSGVIMTLKPGLYEFKIRNGEIVLWYPDQDSFANNDLNRIIEQIKVGNFDIKSPLDFFGVTTDILPQIPAELVRERNIQIVSAPDPVVK